MSSAIPAQLRPLAMSESGAPRVWKNGPLLAGAGGSIIVEMKSCL